MTRALACEHRNDGVFGDTANPKWLSIPRFIFACTLSGAIAGYIGPGFDRSGFEPRVPFFTKRLFRGSPEFMERDYSLAQQRKSHILGRSGAHHCPFRSRFNQENAAESGHFGGNQKNNSLIGRLYGGEGGI